MSPPEDGYGSMQVHNVATKQTLFAINHWSAGGAADLGIGNGPGQTPDWTFSGNAQSYSQSDFVSTSGKRHAKLKNVSRIGIGEIMNLKGCVEDCMQAIHILVVKMLSIAMTTARCFGQETIDQSPFPPVPIESVARYQALRANGTMQVDGKLDESSWQNAPRSPKFVDLISGKPTIHDTQAAVLWDDQYLYVGYWIEEPVVQGKFTKRDSPIYEDNDVELFIAGADCYYELEINSLGTLYEGLFVWQSEYEKKGFHEIPELDQKRSEVKFQPFNGVGLTNHPRGLRWAISDGIFPS